jgi:hypothetical protein
MSRRTSQPWLKLNCCQESEGTLGHHANKVSWEFGGEFDHHHIKITFDW